MNALTLINDALLEINVLEQGETASAAVAQFCLGRLNGILDEFSAAKRYCYNVNFQAFTLVAGLSPHTIGPSGTFVVPNRPSRIEGATLILNTSPQNVDLPMAIQDDQWWNYQRVKSLQSNVPTDLYYSPDIPNGSLYFWPVPNFAYGVRLETSVILQQIASLTAALILPPAYYRALMLSLAVDIATPMGGSVPATTAAKQMRSVRILQGNTMASPTTTTAEAGQKGGRTEPYFNYVSGSFFGDK